MLNESTAVEALHRAVAIRGSQAAFAELLGKSQQAISKLMRKRRVLPAEHVLAVEAATGVSRHELRPDIYPIESSESPTNRVGDPRPVRTDLPAGRGSASSANGPLEGLRT